MLSNLALCFLGKVAVNLNYTAGSSVIQSALRQCSSKHVLTSKRFIQRMPLDVWPHSARDCQPKNLFQILPCA